MEELRKRVAVKVEREFFPFNGASIPPCRVQSIAITKGNEVDSFVLFVGTDSGHLLRYLLPSPFPQDSSNLSPNQTPPQYPTSAHFSPPIPPLALPPSPAHLSTSSVNELSHGLSKQHPAPGAVPSADSHSPMEKFLEESQVAAPPSLSSSSQREPHRERNGAISNSHLRQSQILQSNPSSSPNVRQVSNSVTSSRENKHPESHQGISTSSSSSSSSSSQLPASLSSLRISAVNAASHNSVPLNSLDPTSRGELENGGLAHHTQSVRSFTSSRSSSPPLSAPASAESRIGGGNSGEVGIPPPKCKSVSKSPLETLCPLPECGRIAILSDGHVALLDLQNLNILDRLSGSKGAVTMARGLDAMLPIPYSSSSLVMEEELPEPRTRALVARNDSVNKLFGRGKFSTKFGGLVGGLDRAFSYGRGEADNKRTGVLGRIGNLNGTTRSKASRSSRSSAGMQERVVSTGSARLAVAVRTKIVLFEFHNTVVDEDAQREGLEGRKGGNSNNVPSTWKMREIAGIEGVVTIAWLGDVIFAGTRHEYLLFSLTSGLPTHLFSLPEEIAWQPLLKAFPKNKEALLLIDNAGIPINTEGHPSGGSLLFQILPDGIGCCPPYVIVAKQGVVEIYHHRTGAKIQSLSLGDGGQSRNLVADDEEGRLIIVANSFKVFCIRQVPLDEQLKELLKRRAFKDAERLAEEGQGETGGESRRARLAMVHAQIGFLLVSDLQFEQAMDQFLMSDIMEPSELFPFFDSLTSRWRTMVPRKRYWGLHPPPQPMRSVIELGLLSMQSGLLKSAIIDGSGVEDILVGLKSGKDSLVERYLTLAKEHVARYLGIVREKRELRAFEKEGVDTLLMKLYCKLGFSTQLENLAASPNHCVLDEVERLLQNAGQLQALTRLYESKGLYNLALQVWQSLAQNPVSAAGFGVGEAKSDFMLGPTSEKAVTEAVRLLELSSDTHLVLQHIKWIMQFDQNLALSVLTSSKRESPLSPEDTLLALESDGGVVQQRYLLWLVEEQGLEDKFYHTELALSLAKSAVRSLDKGHPVIGEAHSGNQKEDETHHGTITLKTTSVSVDSRDFLLTFLEKSNGYDAQSVLDIIKDSALWKEQFVLHRKLGDEISALRTLALKLEDSGAAERYCAEVGKAEAYQALMDMYLNPGEGREPMHRAAVRLLNCHGASLDSRQVLEALPPGMPLSAAAETLAQLMVSRVHQLRQGQIARQLVRKDNLESRISRVEERSRNVTITPDSTCGSCGARIGTKYFAVYPDDYIVCYKCLRRFGENARPVMHRTSDRGFYSAASSGKFL